MARKHGCKLSLRYRPPSSRLHRPRSRPKWKACFLILVGSGHSAEAMTELRNHAAAGCNILEAIELDVGEAELTSSKLHDLEAVMRRAAERLAFVRRPIAARTY